MKKEAVIKNKMLNILHNGLLAISNNTTDQGILVTNTLNTGCAIGAVKYDSSISFTENIIIDLLINTNNYSL